MIDDGYYESEALAGTRPGSQNVVPPAARRANRFLLVFVKAERFAEAVRSLVTPEDPTALAMKQSFLNKIIKVLRLFIGGVQLYQGFRP